MKCYIVGAKNMIDDKMVKRLCKRTRHNYYNTCYKFNTLVEAKTYLENQKKLTKECLDKDDFHEFLNYIDYHKDEIRNNYRDYYNKLLSEFIIVEANYEIKETLNYKEV